ncbi:MAG: tRNA1(Val) (adenine(37)-N6)-methyltransferase [Acutalibacteraceae bacterium]|nr:tRNA1(Val) (adenine(37)-N6)-methyltransferase [Acutalibacteraceae bacterium]
MLKDNEELQPLGNGINVIVSNEHHFFTDTILLAHFSKPKSYETAVDLGTGCGTIPLLWNREKPPKHTYAVEIQENGADMATRSVAMNNLQDKITILNKDLRQLKGSLTFGSFDVVVCNPPYKPLGTGIVSSGESHSIIRHESSCTVEDVVKTASALLRFGGRFCLCLRPERLTDVITAMRENLLEPKRLRMVQQHTNKAPKLFLIEGKRGGKAGGLVVEPALLIEKENGEFSDEMMSIYGSFKELT